MQHFYQPLSSNTAEDRLQVLAGIRRCVEANVKSRVAIRWLLAVLTQATDAHVRNQAALALGDLRIQAAVPVLVRLLSDEATAQCRGTLLFALASLDYRDHLDAIAVQLGSNGYEVMEMALQLLEQLPRRLKARHTKEAIRYLERLSPTTLNADYVNQGLILLKRATQPKARVLPQPLAS